MSSWFYKFAPPLFKWIPAVYIRIHNIYIRIRIYEGGVHEWPQYILWPSSPTWPRERLNADRRNKRRPMKKGQAGPLLVGCTYWPNKKTKCCQLSLGGYAPSYTPSPATSPSRNGSFRMASCCFWKRSCVLAITTHGMIICPSFLHKIKRRITTATQ